MQTGTFSSLKWQIPNAVLFRCLERPTAATWDAYNKGLDVTVVGQENQTVTGRILAWSLDDSGWTLLLQPNSALSAALTALTERDAHVAEMGEMGGQLVSANKSLASEVDRLQAGSTYTQGVILEMQREIDALKRSLAQYEAPRPDPSP